jgi:hypothetical protein
MNYPTPQSHNYSLRSRSRAKKTANLDDSIFGHLFAGFWKLTDTFPIGEQLE